METMHLITTTHDADMTQLADESIEALFAASGLSVEIVDHCDTASCPLCFRAAPAKAA